MDILLLKPNYAEEKKTTHLYVHIYVILYYVLYIIKNENKEWDPVGRIQIRHSAIQVNTDGYTTTATATAATITITTILKTNAYGGLTAVKCIIKLRRG